jgi:multisubunit Na+/H+ antiporter MnhE subunit
LVLVRATTRVGAFSLTSSNEAALLVTLTPGSYTVQVRSADATTGVAPAEVYEVP